MSLLFSFLTSSFFRKIFPYLLAILIFAGYSWFMYHEGHSKASSECKAAELQTQLDGQVAKYNHLKLQYDAAENLVIDLNSKKDKVRVVTQEVIKKIPVLVKDNRACDIDSNAIKEINKARAGK